MNVVGVKKCFIACGNTISALITPHIHCWVTVDGAVMLAKSLRTRKVGTPLNISIVNTQIYVYENRYKN